MMPRLERKGSATTNSWYSGFTEQNATNTKKGITAIERYLKNSRWLLPLSPAHAGTLCKEFRLLLWLLHPCSLRPPNGPATQRRGPRRGMVTHSRRGNVAGHVRCSGLLGGALPCFLEVQRPRQLTAFFTSAPILASSAAVN